MPKHLQNTMKKLKIPEAYKKPSKAYFRTNINNILHHKGKPGTIRKKKKHRTDIWSSLSNLVAWQWLVYHCRHCSACKRSLLLHSTNALYEALPCLWRKHWDKASHHDSEILTQQWSFKTRLNCVAWRSEDSRCAPDQLCKWAVTSVFSWHCGHVYNPEEMFRSILKKQINSCLNITICQVKIMHVTKL